VALKIQHLKSN